MFLKFCLKIKLFSGIMPVRSQKTEDGRRRTEDRRQPVRRSLDEDGKTENGRRNSEVHPMRYNVTSIIYSLSHGVNQEIRYGNGSTLLYLRILPIPMAQVLCKPNLFDSCRKYSTNRLIFMQNKANFQKSQMDIKLNISKDYEKNIALDIW